MKNQPSDPIITNNQNGYNYCIKICLKAIKNLRKTKGAKYPFLIGAKP